MAVEYFCGLMDPSISATEKMTKLMVLEDLFMRMGMFMKGSLEMVKEMDKENFFMLMSLIIKASLNSLE